MISVQEKQRSKATPLAVPTSVFLVLAVVFWGFTVYRQSRLAADFDDSFMFYRYAENMRHGFGMAWNPPGPHTFGQTSLLWALIVLLSTFFPGSITIRLKLLSCLFSGLAIIAIAWAVRRNAVSERFRSWKMLLPLVAIPLLLAWDFLLNMATGMETMLAMTLVAVYCGLVLRWNAGQTASWICGCVGLALLLSRPESGIVVVLLPVCVFLLLRGQRQVKDVAVLLGVFAAGVALILVGDYFYFGTALPLSFYIKSQHFYEGYRKSWQPVSSFATFLSAASFYLAAAVIWGRRSSLRLALAFALPLLAVSLYLFRVLQIMNFLGRYYLPYLPLIVIPALLTLDASLTEREANKVLPEETSWGLRASLLLVVIGIATAAYPFDMLSKLDKLVEEKKVEYDEAKFVTPAQKNLPDMSRAPLFKILSAELLQHLPAGASIASSEVGYIGAESPQVLVFDLAGLNDTEIALHGFHAGELLARHPDMIWMPHPDYTYERGEIFTAPGFLEQYTFYAGAADFGFAIRKESPYRGQIDAGWKRVWDTLYPGLAMADYRVQAIQWSGLKHNLN